MDSVEHVFGEFRLLPAARELFQGQDRLSVPRLVFDCLAYLTEHRDRAVGRDELAAAVWGRVDVPEVRVNELVLRARRTIGDDGQMQRAIRTVSGFGYRWVAETTTNEIVPSTPTPVRNVASASETGVVDPVAQPATVADDGRVPGIGDAASAPASDTPRTARRAVVLAATVLLLALAGLIAFSRWFSAPTPPPESIRMIMVLPVTVDAAREANWVRLGAMDLIVDRLHNAGLPVLPSESTLIALNSSASERRPDAEVDVAALERRFGVGPVVQGNAAHSPTGWTVVLTARTAGDRRQLVHAEHGDVIAATRQAADRLIAALGRVPPADGGAGAATDLVQERLHQAQAALLAGQLDQASALLADMPERDRHDPRVRFHRAQVDFHAGRLDEALATYTALLETVEISDRLLHGRIYSARAATRYRRREFEQALVDYDAAVAVLQELDNAPELGRALSGRGGARIPLRQFEAAASDLGQARIELEQAGDRLGLAQVDIYFGLIESEWGRHDLALPYLTRAAETFAAFGASERTLSSLTAVFDAQAELLRWQDAMATSERQWAMRDAVNDPVLGLLIAGRRQRVLLALGRYREAEQLLAEIRTLYGDIRPNAKRYLYDIETDFAWHLGRYADTVAAADRALSTWPADPIYDRYGYLVLLRQRALIRSDRASPESVERFLPPADNEKVSPIFDIARAEWSLAQGRPHEAMRIFNIALKKAQSQGMPAGMVLVAASYGDWLLAEGRLDEASALAGRVASLAEQDFVCALLQLRVLHRLGHHDSWKAALRRAQALAGERTIPSELLSPP